ncbi:uncharacterized protein LOC129726848 isoform X4 [Wyeomyia smithii]|uniref:uncharacterized protein LOC129726848 isoform X4 n=1 Tax=Wyeomyia smithii TaxID=174621 RepID=UPI0024680588|nr:uncharacterized protein LOC129726848 isoform X4 [Wyeomyia smithii]
MHQQQMQMQHPSAIHPASMHVSAGLPANHFLPSPALASPVGSTGGNQPPNPPLAANAPCSTLFVANLGQFVSEHELKEIFASLPGFSRLRMHSKGTSAAATAAAAAAAAATSTTSATITTTFNTNAAIQGNNYNSNNNIPTQVPVAFVEFKDVASAATAMSALQGKYLLSSDRGAMRIEFAKSKMAADLPSHHFYHIHMQQREYLD